MIVFVMNAGPLDLSEIKASGVPIIAAGYSGEQGGRALAEVIIGSYNPGGATTTTWLPEEYTKLASFQDLNMRPRSETGYPGRTYRFLNETAVMPLWRFGYGLSYTSFKIDIVQNPSGPLSPGESSTWTVQVSNIGKTIGGVVVVCYVAAIRQQEVTLPPVRSSFGFARIEGLLPGTHELLSFPLTSEARSLVGDNGARLNPHGQYGVECEAGGVAKTKKMVFEIA